jgi:hypothetical protein
MAFDYGDTFIVRRGLHRNEMARVLGVDKEHQQYAVTFLDDGSVGVVNADNTRSQAEPTITATALAEAFGAYGGEIPNAVIEALEALAPGITAKIVLVKVV